MGIEGNEIADKEAKKQAKLIHTPQANIDGAGARFVQYSTPLSLRSNLELLPKRNIRKTSFLSQHWPPLSPYAPAKAICSERSSDARLSIFKGL